MHITRQVSLFPSFEVKAALAKSSFLLWRYYRAREEQRKTCTCPLSPPTCEKGRHSTAKLTNLFQSQLKNGCTALFSFTAVQRLTDPGNRICFPLLGTAPNSRQLTIATETHTKILLTDIMNISLYSQQHSSSMS